MNPKEFRYKLGYQPRWDMLGRMLQNVTKNVPMMSTPGNHDVEPQPDGTVFAAYNSRWAGLLLAGIGECLAGKGLLVAMSGGHAW
jgi:hypothetical protein